MKFVLAVVMLVLATAVQSSVLPLGLGLGLGGVGPWGGVSPWGGLGVHGPSVAVHAAAPWGLTGLGVPGISLSQGPGLAGPLGVGHGLGSIAGPLAVGNSLGLGLGHGLGHEGVYVAKTRGAIHTAPLAGHISSAASVNVAPAPGTL